MKISLANGIDLCRDFTTYSFYLLQNRGPPVFCIFEGSPACISVCDNAQNVVFEWEQLIIVF
jgi:hypothetical protein